MSVNNLGFWESVSGTDGKYTYPINVDGKELTGINPTYQIMRATDEWGPMGIKWGVRNPVYDRYQIGKSVSVSEKDGKKYINTTLLLNCDYTAELYYPHDGAEGIIYIESSREITSFNGKLNNSFKKSLTADALNKGLSRLGFSSNIYMSIADDAQGLQSYENNKIGDFKDPFSGPGIDLEKQENINKKSEDELDIKFKEALDEKDYDEDKKKSLIAETSTFVKKSFIDGTIPEL